MSALTPQDTYSELGQACDLITQFDALAGQFLRGLDTEIDWRDYRYAMNSMRRKCTQFREHRRQHRIEPPNQMPAGWHAVDVSGTITIQHGLKTVASLHVAEGIPFRTWIAEQLAKALAETEPPCDLEPISRLGEPDSIHCRTHGDDCTDPGPDAA